MRPRERLIRQGVHALDPASLLALLLGTGQGQKEDAYQMAQRILYQCGGVKQLIHSDLSTLLSLKGIGEVKACRLLAAFELTRRVLQIEHQIISTDTTYPSYKSYREKLVRIARDLWVEDTHMVLAYPYPFIDEIQTLSLDQKISEKSDLISYLRQLVLVQNAVDEISNHTSSFQYWIIFILQACEHFSETDQSFAEQLHQKAEMLGIPIYTIMMISESQDWVLHTRDPNLSAD